MLSPAPKSSRNVYAVAKTVFTLEGWLSQSPSIQVKNVCNDGMRLLSSHSLRNASTRKRDDHKIFRFRRISKEAVTALTMSSFIDCKKYDYKIIKNPTSEMKEDSTPIESPLMLSNLWHHSSIPRRDHRRA